MPIVLLLAALVISLQQAPAPAAAQTPPNPNSRVWIGHYAEFEEFLRTARIVRTEGTSVGVTGPRHAFFEPGGLAKGAAVKNLPPAIHEGYFESYRSEIAAYKLDRLLDLDMVPPTVERRVNGDLVSVQLWIENTRMLLDVTKLKLRAPDQQAYDRQMNRVRVFDVLVANVDENQGNLLFDPAWHFIKIDHSRCFTTNAQTNIPLTRIDRPFFEHVKTLDREAVRRELGEWLEGGALGALLSRRDQIVKTFENLAKKNGDAKVFTP